MDDSIFKAFSEFLNNFIEILIIFWVWNKNGKWSPTIHIYHQGKRATERGEEGRPPLPLFENEKSVLILEKKTLILSILRLNLPFKMYF